MVKKMKAPEQCKPSAQLHCMLQQPAQIMRALLVQKGHARDREASAIIYSMYIIDNDAIVII